MEDRPGFMEKRDEQMEEKEKYKEDQNRRIVRSLYHSKDRGEWKENSDGENIHFQMVHLETEDRIIQDGRGRTGEAGCCLGHVRTGVSRVPSQQQDWGQLIGGGALSYDGFCVADHALGTYTANDFSDFYAFIYWIH